MKTTEETKTIDKEKVTTPQTPPISGNKETKYCTLLQSTKLEDKENSYTYALERIYIKDIGREEIRLALYRDMRNTSGMINNRLIARPVDLSEQELIQLLDKAIKEKLFSAEFLKYLKNIVNQK